MCIATVSFGQSKYLGVRGGLHWGNVFSSDFVKDKQFQRGISAGVTYDYQPSENVNLGINLLYIEKGFAKSIEFTDESGENTGEVYTIEFSYNYFSIPLKIGFIAGDRFLRFANVGIVPSLLLNAETYTPAFENLIPEETTDITKDVADLDFGLLFEMGLGYRLRDNVEFYTCFTYQQSVTTLTSASYFPDSKIKNMGMTLSLGVRFALPDPAEVQK